MVIFGNSLQCSRREENEKIREGNDEILAVIKSLCGDRGKCRRERKRALWAVMSEFYSPQRFTIAKKQIQS